jgi:GT2 family glycosyltransferase
MPSPKIFIATPVYKGWEWVGETLASIRAQTFTDFRVTLSVDGKDQRSAAVCAAFLDDPRFEMVVQPEQLGWAGNLNWLLERCDGRFFCYWQHDDICDPLYLERLFSAAQGLPQAAATYCDVQWFGARTDLSCQPTIRGLALSRLLEQVERLDWAAFRGLIRGEVLARVGPLRITSLGSSMEDLVWIAKLAREGELHRVPETLYFKRAHHQSAHAEWHAWPEAKRRAVWLELGLGFVEAALPLLTREDDHPRLLEHVLSRLLVPRADRWLFYAPADDTEREGFAREFVQIAMERFKIAEPGMLWLC